MLWTCFGVWDDLNRDRRVSQCRLNAIKASENTSIFEVKASADLRTEIRRIQGEDLETQRRKAAIQARSAGLRDWRINTDNLITFRDRLYIPATENLRQTLLKLYHDDPLAGHFGKNRTTELLKRKFHWVNLKNDVEEYIKGYAICQGAIAPRYRPYSKLENLPIPPRPFAELTMDFITGLPEAIFQLETVDAILVVVDRFTKYCLFFPVSKTINAAELAELFHNKVELKFGPPDGIVSDRGSVFTSKFWSKLCFLSHVKLRLSTAFHPQTDGQTERINQTLKYYLRYFIDIA